MTGIDKRDFYRLPDEIRVSYQLVSPGEMKRGSASDHFNLPRSFHLMHEIYELEMESTELLRTITEKQRPLGNFLHNLNRRIEILTQALLTDEHGADFINQETLISEGGLSFINDTLLPENAALALKLVFHPSMLGLTCFAEVRHCRLSEDGRLYRIGVRFLDLDVINQRLISRHIIRRQSEERRQRLRANRDYGLNQTHDTL